MENRSDLSGLAGDYTVSQCGKYLSPLPPPGSTTDLLPEERRNDVEAFIYSNGSLINPDYMPSLRCGARQEEEEKTERKIRPP